MILDTSIIIDHIRQPEKSSKLDELKNGLDQETFAMSLVTVQELYAGKSTKDPEKERVVQKLVSELVVLPYTSETAKLAGEITRDRPSPLEFADAAIAATAIINESQLFTLNKKDFERIDGLRLI